MFHSISKLQVARNLLSGNEKEKLHTVCITADYYIFLHSKAQSSDPIVPASCSSRRSGPPRPGSRPGSEPPVVELPLAGWPTAVTDMGAGSPASRPSRRDRRPSRLDRPGPWTQMGDGRFASEQAPWARRRAWARVCVPVRVCACACVRVCERCLLQSLQAAGSKSSGPYCRATICRQPPPNPRVIPHTPKCYPTHTHKCYRTHTQVRNELPPGPTTPHTPTPL